MRNCSYQVGRWTLCTDNEYKKHLGEKLSNHCYLQYNTIWQHCGSLVWMGCKNDNCEKYVYEKREAGTFSGLKPHWNRVSVTISCLRSGSVSEGTQNLISYSSVPLSGNASVIGWWDTIASSEGRLVVRTWRRCIAMSEGRCEPWVVFPYKVVRRWYVPGTLGTGI